MILPKDRDPRFVTIRRGGTLTDSDHQLLALWAASCAEHVLDLFESAQPEDPRPRQAIEQTRAWVRGEITMSQARTATGAANAAARDLSGAARAAAPEGEGESAPGDWSVGGSATSSWRPFASSYSTTSGCGTTSAGQCSTAESVAGRQHFPTSASSGRRELDSSHRA